MKFQLLGPVEARGRNGPIDLLGPMIRATLAVLLVENRRLVTRERLIKCVREDAITDFADPREQAHTYVSRLRKCLEAGGGSGSLIPKREPGYRLLVDPDDVDLHRFTRLAAKVADLTRENAERNASEIARLGREALREWGGTDAMPHGAEPLEDIRTRWADDVRADLRLKRREVLLACLEAELKSAPAAGHLLEPANLHRADPLNERILRLLMRAHCRAGDPASAMKIFDDFRERSAREYGSDPSPETWDLVRRINAHDPDLGPPPTESSDGGEMPSADIEKLAGRMAEALAPAWPFLTGAVAPAPGRQAGGEFWATAKDLWRLLRGRGIPMQVPVNGQGRPDRDALRARLAEVLAGDATLAGEAAAALDGNAAPQDAGARISVAGHYFHQGDNIHGTSIKYYGG